MQLRTKKKRKRLKLRNWQEKMKPLQQLPPQENWKKMLLVLMVCTGKLQKLKVWQMNYMTHSTTIGGMSGIQHMRNSMNIMNMQKKMKSKCGGMKMITIQSWKKLIDLTLRFSLSQKLRRRLRKKLLTNKKDKLLPNLHTNKKKIEKLKPRLQKPLRQKKTEKLQKMPQ